MTLRDVVAVGGTFAKVVFNSCLMLVGNSVADSALPLERQIAQLSAKVGALVGHDDEARADGVLTIKELQEYVLLARDLGRRCQELEKFLLRMLTRAGGHMPAFSENNKTR